MYMYIWQTKMLLLLCYTVVNGCYSRKETIQSVSSLKQTSYSLSWAAFLKTVAFFTACVCYSYFAHGALWSNSQTWDETERAMYWCVTL